jgi:hypothetical protein
MNYKIIGHNTNLPARLQNQTKVFVWSILTSETNYKLVKDAFDAGCAAFRLIIVRPSPWASIN